MKIWKPSDPKAVALIKLTIWSGLLVWSIFTVTLSVLYARQFALLGMDFLPEGTWNEFLVQWVGPSWIIFTTLMLIWAVLRFAHKRLRRGKNDTPR